MNEYVDDLSVTTAPLIPWWIYGVIGVIVLIIVVVLVWKLKRLLTRPETQGLTREEIAKRWQVIRQTSSQGMMGTKVALMEADMLLDSALKSLAMPGLTLGERLKVACYKYPALRNVWWAHKLRNQLVHEASFQIGERQAKQALDEFEKALKLLNLL